MRVTANDDSNGRVRALGFLLVAVLASALAVLTVRSDVLTGTTPAVTARPQPCAAPEVAPDLSPVVPGNALTTIRGSLPMLPLPDLGVVTSMPYRQYDSPALYERYTPILLAGKTRSAMEDNGFVMANVVGYEAGPTMFLAEAIQTASPAQAAALEHQLLDNACQAGLASGVRSVAGVTGGVGFVYHDWTRPPFRAMFLVGDTVVRLNMCICDDNRGDPYTVLDGWARAVNASMRLGNL